MDAVMGYAVIFGYLAGYVLTARKVALYEIEEQAAGELSARRRHLEIFRTRHADEGKPLVDLDARVMALMWGLILALFWPMVVAAWAVLRTLRAPTEIAEDERAELEALRALAREHNLPMPGDRP